MAKQKGMSEEEKQKILDYLYDPQTFYDYGDNPALQRYIEIMQQNCAEGQMIDPRTQVFLKNQRLFFARNVEDFIARDLKAFNFVRAFPVWLMSLGYFGMSCIHLRKFYPVGARGITKISQTSFYENYGSLGLAGFGLYFGSAAYIFWQTTKYTAKKFYSHVLLGERQWYWEKERNNNTIGLYYFKDSPLSCEESYPDIARVEIARKIRPEGTWAK
ncbi:hypothetical protein pb186bvf_006993 [Paramecium bursaria]